MKKIVAMTLALTMLLAILAGCGGAPVSQPEPDPEPVSQPEAEPVSAPSAVEGVVREVSQGKLSVTLADGTTLAFDTTGVTGLEAESGDTVKVEYTGAVGAMTASKVEVTAKAEKEIVTVSGVVTGLDDEFVYLTLEDGTDAALRTVSMEEGEVEEGDTLTIHYTDGGGTILSIDVTKAEKPEETSATEAAAPAAGTQTASSSGSAGSSSSSASSGATQAASGTLVTERSVEEGRAWYRAAVDLGGNLDDLVAFVKGEDVYPYGTSLYKDYYNFFKYEWDGISDWKTVSLDDDDDDIPSNRSSSGSSSSSGGSSKSQSQSEPAESAGDVYEAIRLINAERKNAGLKELTVDSDLMAMAAVRASEISEDYEGTGIKHYRPNGEYFLSIFDEYGWKYSWAEENVDASQATAAKTVSRWMNSAVHKANILNDEITRIGLGYYYDSNSDWKYHWVMLAGNPLK